MPESADVVRPGPPRLLLIVLALLTVAADQITKFAVVRTLEVGESRPVIDGVVWLTHVRNTGAAFGLFRGFGGLLAVAAAVGLVLFTAILLRRPPFAIGLGAALIAGGTLGNLADRAFRPWPFRGSVVDFVDLRFWPAFNVADAAISVGAVLLLVASMFEGRTRPHAARDDTDLRDHAPDR